jgi:hypothetical protein
MGFSAGLVNYFSVFCLFGAIMLLNIASPILVYRMRMGLISGLVALLFILPYSIIFAISLFQDWSFGWSLFMIEIPSILFLICLYVTVKYLFIKGHLAYIKPISRTTKLILSLSPLILTALYIAQYGRYWALSNLLHLNKS